MTKLKDRLFQERRAIDVGRAQIEKEFTIVFGDVFLAVNESGGLQIELPVKKTLLSDEDALKFARWIERLFKDEKPPEPEPTPVEPEPAPIDPE